MYFYLPLTYTFTIQIPNVVTVQYQSTNAQNVLHLNARMDTSDHGLLNHSQGSGAVDNGLPVIKKRFS
jgi:hypothetical protein